MLFTLTIADTMTIKLLWQTQVKSKLVLTAIVVMSVIGCEQQPKSMFEQHAESESAPQVKADAADTETDTENGAHDNDEKDQQASHASTSLEPINIIKQHAIARQPNCDPAQSECQYFELNVLSFTPEQPWFTSIMWQTIARVLAPETPLASRDETAKKTVLMLFNQIEYAEKKVDTLPLYQRIDTELVLNSLPNEDKAALPKADTIATGYLVVRSNNYRLVSRQHVDYVMFDMSKKLQLTIQDVLLEPASADKVKLAFKTAKKEWLMQQGVEQKDIEQKDLDKSPFILSSQWYLDAQGLHMVYQSGELVDTQAVKDKGAIDLIVPYAELTGIIKPEYVVIASVKSAP